MESKRSDGDDGSSPGKIFIGGLAKETTIDTFVKYFGKYGEITDSVIMKDRLTGKPRGFGFITYADPSVVDTIIKETHVINGKQVEIKRTIPRGSSDSKDFKTKKIFVGGIPAVVTEDEFKEFFSKYGKVSEHEIIRDHVTKRSRGFGFIVFENEQTVDEVLVNGTMVDMNGTQVEIKKAEPKKPSVSGYNYNIREPKGRGYSGSYDAYDDSFRGYSGGGGGGYGPPPYRSFGAPLSRFGEFGPYGPGAGEFGGRYGGEYGGGEYSGYRGGEPPLGGYPSRFSSFSSGGSAGSGYGGGYGAGGLGGYGRGGGVGGGGYGGYGGPGGGGGVYESGAGSGYGGAGGPYGSRAGYSGTSRYHPYGR